MVPSKWTCWTYSLRDRTNPCLDDAVGGWPIPGPPQVDDLTPKRRPVTDTNNCIKHDHVSEITAVKGVFASYISSNCQQVRICGFIDKSKSWASTRSWHASLSSSYLSSYEPPTHPYRCPSDCSPVSAGRNVTRARRDPHRLINLSNLSCYRCHGRRRRSE